MATGPVRATDREQWNDHWDEFAASAALNPAQAYRRKLVFELLALDRAKAPVRLLDLGSGTGDFALEVSRARADAEIVGLDLSASGVSLATRKVPRGRFFQQDFTAPIEIDARYRGWATHAVCSEVLEHVDDPAAVLRNVATLLAPGCRLVVTVPGGPMSAFDKHIGHRGHFRVSRLEQTLRDAGFEVEDLRGAGFPFFNLYRLAVVARGKKLIEDASGTDADLPLAARATMQAFSWLFRLNASKTKLGWQLVARARYGAGAPVSR
jgi:2-polyprenyl-3-methyl-5-hydroxy-6-metoxy-1,4-benzoquinol methylase